jgi:hypothetical protein
MNTEIKFAGNALVKRVLAGHRGVPQMNQGNDMSTPSRIANVCERSDFGSIVRFCAIGLLLTLVFVIAVRLTLGEWLEILPGG